MLLGGLVRVSSVSAKTPRPQRVRVSYIIYVFPFCILIHLLYTATTLQQSASPLYTPPTTRPGSHLQPGASPSPSLLTLDPHPSHSQPMSQQQLQLLEEAQPVNSYLSARSEAIEAIERTINELGGIFGQLAQMVSEQSEMIQRIDAETEDVVTNVSGAQRELLKYWGRVSSNRWLVVKMFGVLMIFFLLWVLVS